MLRIDKISGVNFILYKEIQIDFRKMKDNLVFVTGENRDTHGSDSNGCGKTQIADLLTDILFDKTIRKHQQKSFIGKHGKFCKTTCELSDDSTLDRYKIVRYRNHPKHGDKVRFIGVVGGIKKEFTRKKKVDTYKSIWKMLGINWNTFKNRNYFGQDDTDRFLNVTDSKKAEIITEILDLEDIQKCKDISHSKARDLKKIILTKESEIDGIRSALATLKKVIHDQKVELVKKKEKLKKEFEEEKQKVIDTRKKLEYARDNAVQADSLRSKSQSIKFNLESTERILDEFQALSSNFDKLTEELKSIQEKIVEKKQELAENSDQLTILSSKKKGKVCKYCKSTLDEKSTKNLYSYFKKKMIEVEKEIEKHEMRIESIKSNISNKNGKLQALKLEKDRLVPLIKKRESILKKLRLAEKWEGMTFSFENELKLRLDEAKRAKKRVEDVPKDAALTRMKKEFGEFKDKLDTQRIILKGIKEEMELNSISEEVYEATMRKMFDDFLAQLEHHSNLFLGDLSDNDIELEFNASRETQSKKIIDEMNVSVSVNGAPSRDFKTYSGGEKGRMSISTQLALFSASITTMPFLFLDEPFAGIDDNGKDRIMSILVDQAAKGTFIMVISHENVVKGYGTQLRIVRKSGRSEIS